METLNTMKSKQMKNDRTTKSSGKIALLDWATEYDALIIFGGFGVAVLITIILTGIFQAGPAVRTNLLYNIFGAGMMAFVFVYLIFNFMGSHVSILGKSIDTGMVIYILIMFFIMFVLGN